MGRERVGGRGRSGETGGGVKGRGGERGREGGREGGREREREGEREGGRERDGEREMVRGRKKEGEGDSLLISLGKERVNFLANCLCPPLSLLVFQTHNCMLQEYMGLTSFSFLLFPFFGPLRFQNYTLGLSCTKETW